MLATEDEVRAVLEPHHAQIAEIFKGAWARWEELSPENRAALSHARCHANSIWGLAIDDARRAFAGDPRVKIEDKGGTVNFHFANKVLARFKKLTRAGRARNLATQLNLEFAAQVSMEGFPEEIRVHVGYVPNATKTAIDAIKVSCPSKRGVAWSYEIPMSVVPIAVVAQENVAMADRPRRARLRAPKLRLLAKDGTTDAGDVKRE